MLSRLELCGNKRDWLADDDAEPAGDAPREYRVECERSQSAVVPAVGEELPAAGVAKIGDELSAPVVVVVA